MPEIPLSLAYLAAALKPHGHDVKIIDLNVVDTLEELKAQLGDLAFDIIGFAATTPIITNCYRIIKIMKKKYPSAKMVLGGWHASALPIQTMNECKEIDYIVKGEGEITFVELAAAIENGSRVEGILGVVYRDDQGIPVENPDRPLINNIDTIPFPDRSLLPNAAYKRNGFYTVDGYYKKDLNISSIFTSRGCANRCKFCADHVIYKETCRFRSPENVISEIEKMVKEQNIRIILFLDANFMFSPTRVKRICELIIEKNLKFIWTCYARVDTISEEILRLMKTAGCIRISYGIESGSPRMLKKMNKNITIKQIKQAIALTKKVGISIYAFFIYGLPGETIQDLKYTRQLMHEIQPDFVSQSVAIPYPGSDIYDEALKENLIKTKDWNSFSFFFNNILSLPDANKIFRFQKKIQRDFYLSPRFIWQSLKKIRSIYHVFFYLRGFRIFLMYFFVMAKKGI
ncbi:MAG: radical SAM protein [Candidatus Sigynarchaeota archaeon]